MRSRSRIALFEKTAESLRASLAANSRPKLPCIDDLSREFGVSYRTMWKAVRLLAERKVLVCSQGRRTRPSVSPYPDSAVDRLVAELRLGIGDGTYPAGAPLPKSAHFALTRHISPGTIAVALRRLRDEGLVHSEGKKWIAGPRRAVDGARQRLSEPPVVVVVFENADSWEVFVNYSHTASFSLPFIGEIGKHGLQVALVSLGSGPSSGVPQGMDGIRSMIRSLGTRYVGTLVVPYVPYYQGFGPCMEALCSYDKPVVFFDAADQGAHLSRREIASKRYYRLYFDEETALSCALANLRDLGHARVGIPVFKREMFEWAARRSGLLQEMVARRYGEMRVTAIDHSEPFWHFEIYTTLQEFVARVEAQTRGEDGTRTASSLRSSLLAQTPSLVSLLFDHQVTALIALNDRMAREYHFWLKSVGIAVPEKLSIVSFDNSPDSIAFPISTVDFGLSSLAYQAAHLFVGDIRVQADRLGNIASRPRLLERGSLAPPRRQQLVR